MIKNKSTIKRIIMFLLAAICSVALLRISRLPIASNNFILFLLFVGIGIVFYYANHSKIKKEWVFVTGIMSGITSAVFVFSKQPEFNNYLHKIIYIGVFYVIFYSLFKSAINLFTKINGYFKIDNDRKRYSSGKVFAILFCLLLLVNVPLFVLKFPGTMSSDSVDQWNQAQGNTSLNDHHPTAHTLLLKVGVSVYQITGNETLGIATNTLVQILIVNLIIAYVLTYLYQKRINKYCFALAIVFYAFLPISIVLNVIVWKDVLFSAFALLFFIEIMELILSKENSTTKISHKILLPLSVLLVGLFRGNGIYVLLATTILLLKFTWKYVKKILLYLVLPLILVIIIKGPVYSHFDIAKPSLEENLAIPMQQVYSLIYNQKEIDVQDKELLTSILPLEVVQKCFNFHTVDNIKFHAQFNHQEFKENSLEFMKLWGKYLIRYPATYIDTYLKTTVGFWSMETIDYSLGDAYSSMMKLPMAKLILSPITYVLIYLATLLILLVKGLYSRLAVPAIPLMIWGTIMIATPISTSSRYVYSIFLMIIPILYFLLDSLKQENGKWGILMIYEKYKTVILYLVFGVITTLINIVSYSILANVIHIDYLVSNLIAWTIAVIVAFLTNRNMVFHSSATTRKEKTIELIKFLVVRVVTLLFDMGIMFIGISLFHANDILIKILANIVVIISNYFFSKIIVFK